MRGAAVPPATAKLSPLAGAKRRRPALQAVLVIAGAERSIGGGDGAAVPSVSLDTAYCCSMYPPFPSETVTYAKCRPGPSGMVHTVSDESRFSTVPPVTRHW